MNRLSRNTWTAILFALPLILYSQNQAWARRYGGSYVDWVEDMAVDQQGNIFVVGELGDNWPDTDFMVLSYDGAGNLRWVRRYNGSGTTTNCANAVVIDSSGHIYVTGHCNESVTDDDYITMKYDSLGDTVWLRRYDNSTDVARAIALDVLGNVYVTGASWENSEDIVTVKYDPSGNQKWVRRYDGSIQYYDGGLQITTDKFNNVFVIGYTYKDSISSDVDFVTIKYDSLGSMRWVRFYNGSADSSWDWPHAVSADENGSVYVTGTSEEIGRRTDLTTIKYDSLGNIVWVRNYDGPVSRYDGGSDIAVAPSGNVYVCGGSESNTNYDLTLIKYSNSGTERWVRRYNGSANLNDYGYSLALDQDENIYVTGFSQELGTGTDYITLKYDSLGNEKWRVNFQGDSADQADKIVLDLAGNVYVTGESDTTNRYRDFVTVKYTNPIKIDEFHPVVIPERFKVTRAGQGYLFKIDFAEPQTLTIRVFDVSGRQRREPIVKQENKYQQFYLDAKSLNNGIYFVSFENTKFSKVVKVVIVR